MVALGVKGPRAREDFFGPPRARACCWKSEKRHDRRSGTM